MTYRPFARAALRYLSITIILVISTLAGTASAAPVVYDEAVGGDLPGGVANDGIALPTFNFDLGVNTISGTVTAVFGEDDRDSFAFIVPEGQQVSAANVTLADLTGNVTQVGWILYRGSNQAFAGTMLETIFAPSPGVTNFTFSLPAPPDVYNMSNFGVNGTSGTAAYTFSFTVVPVPEPASVALLALIGASVLRRSRRKPSSCGES